MPSRSLAIALIASIVGCASPTVRELAIAGQTVAPAVDLPALAADVRRTGGLVFEGAIAIDGLPLDPVLVPTTFADVYVAYPQVGATALVRDALGSTASGELMLVGAGGPETAVDAAGHPAAAVITDVPPDAWRRRELRVGTAVFFVSPRTDGAYDVRWRADVDASGVVDGSGTRSGLPSTLAELDLGR